jgi:hypothetical protein
MKTKVLPILGITLIVALVVVAFMCIITPMLNEKEIENTDLKYKTEAIKTHLYKEEINEPIVNVITSLNDLNEYIKDYEDDNLKEKLSKYSDEYFSTKALLIVTKLESSGSNTNKIDRVEKIDSKLNIYINRYVADIGTTDMAMWHLLIELDKEVIEDIEEISVK